MRFVLAAALLLAFVPAASAASQDSLLSGYGGPGDGEQALLGETLIRDSGATAPAAGAPAAQATAPVPAPEEIYAPATPAETVPPARPGRRPSREQQRPDRRPAAEKPVVTPTDPAPAAPASAVPVASTEAPAPLAGRDLVLLLAALVVLVVLAAAARRLAVRAARVRRPVPVQAP